MVLLSPGLNTHIKPLTALHMPRSHTAAKFKQHVTFCGRCLLLSMTNSVLWVRARAALQPCAMIVVQEYRNYRVRSGTKEAIQTVALGLLQMWSWRGINPSSWAVVLLPPNTRLNTRIEPLTAVHVPQPQLFASRLQQNVNKSLSVGSTVDERE